MKIFLTKSHIAQENLALEETILKDEQIKEDVIMFYINKNCIVIGRNQNVWEEINDAYVKQKKINLVRRISGGGAVYQDVNNICFSFITSASKSYSEFLKPVLEFLKTLGLDAQFHGKNDIHVNGYKVSGNAQFKYKNRMVHHGTILFNTNLAKLASALKPNQLKMESKGIKSHRQRVKNLYELLENKISTKNFVDEMVAFFKLKYNAILFNESNYKLEEVARLTKIRSSKEWVYGKNPEFEITNHKRFAGGTIKLLLNTSKNKIKDINFTGDFLSKVNLQEIFVHFIGKEYEKDVMKKTLDAIDNWSDFFGQIKKEEILSLFFDN